MLWILEITVIGFLFGEPALQFDGIYKEKFITEKACNEFKQSSEVEDESVKLKRTARQHLNDRYADVTIKFECVVFQEGEPA